MRSLIVRGGRLALPAGIVSGDLRVDDGRITELGALSARGADVELNAKGLLVMPGAIDPQVHFRDPGGTHKEDLYTGSRAAAAGGVTTFFEMPNTNPPTTTLEAMAAKKQRAAEVSAVNYGFFIGATPHNVEVLNSVQNVPGIKIFMGSSTGTLLVSERAALDNIFGHGRRLIAVHAEDEARLVARIAQFAGATDPAKHTEIRDAEAARLASELALELSEKYGRRLHILHLSTGDEVRMLRARGKGQGRVTAEVTPQHLLLEAPEIYERLGTLAQMNPPLRAREHCEELWRGLHDGTIDCIATDHAPHTLEEKAKGYGKAPSGMPGVETSLAVMLNAAHHGRCSVEQVVHWMSAAAARCYRLKNKGELKVGFDGDLTLVDLARREKVGARGYFTKVGWSPFDGMELTGWPVTTVVGGQVVFQDGAIVEGVRGTEAQFHPF